MTNTVIVIGAGAGGLAAAIALAAAGHEVTVMDAQSGPGGKMLPQLIDGESNDTGPTVLTMRWVFEELFAKADANLGDYLTLTPLNILARHFWSGGKTLDLHCDPQQSAEAIGHFAGRAEADGFRTYLHEAQKTYGALRDVFLKSQRPTLWGLARSLPLKDLIGLNAMEGLWPAICRHFNDAKLRQLFGRYATYCGTSPFKAPATLMLIAAVEAEGVWQIEGGMQKLASALEKLAKRMGVVFHYNTTVRHIKTNAGHVSGVITSNDEQHACDLIVYNGDQAAVGRLLGLRTSPLSKAHRSLSAVTWNTKAAIAGADLSHHNVFFSDDYETEFKQLETGTASDPTTYLCEEGEGRKLILINAPADGLAVSSQADVAMRRRLERCGFEFELSAQTLRRDPKDFASLYASTDGALYGRASNGWMASFQRPAARTKMPGLYLAGGSVHPGPGVPMACLSGMLAAQALMEDRASTLRSRQTVIAGGTLTH